MILYHFLFWFQGCFCTRNGKIFIENCAVPQQVAASVHKNVEVYFYFRHYVFKCSGYCISRKDTEAVSRIPFRRSSFLPLFFLPLWRSPLQFCSGLFVIGISQNRSRTQASCGQDKQRRLQDPYQQCNDNTQYHFIDMVCFDLHCNNRSCGVSLLSLLQKSKKQRRKVSV